jgi:hypothetical protein
MPEEKVKLLDFGLATTMETAGDTSQVDTQPALTVPGAVVRKRSDADDRGGRSSD